MLGFDVGVGVERTDVLLLVLGFDVGVGVERPDVLLLVLGFGVRVESTDVLMPLSVVSAASSVVCEMMSSNAIDDNPVADSFVFSGNSDVSFSSSAMIGDRNG